MSEASQNSEMVHTLQDSIDAITNEKNGLLNEINHLNSTIAEMNDSVASLNAQISDYQSKSQEVQASGPNAETEAFIDKLFKQIDMLNDERLKLYTEKEEMAAQLLKMNEVIAGISQNVDSQSINVNDLNNHRRNVILAKNSEGDSERAQMKKQINELVREIDKCIALLSA